MGSINNVLIVGRLGADPESRETAGGLVTNLRVATSEQWTGKDGQRQEKTEWHRVAVWGNQAGPCAEYLRKGSECCVEGKIETRTWDKDGVKQYSTEIRAHRVTFLGSKQDSRPASQGQRGGYGGGGGGYGGL